MTPELKAKPAIEERRRAGEPHANRDANAERVLLDLEDMVHSYRTMMSDSNKADYARYCLAVLSYKTRLVSKLRSARTHIAKSKILKDIENVEIRYDKKQFYELLKSAESIKDPIARGKKYITLFQDQKAEVEMKRAIAGAKSKSETAKITYDFALAYFENAQPHQAAKLTEYLMKNVLGGLPNSQDAISLASKIQTLNKKCRFALNSQR